jgi:hypothetical protein
MFFLSFTAFVERRYNITQDGNNTDLSMNASSSE